MLFDLNFNLGCCIFSSSKATKSKYTKAQEMEDGGPVGFDMPGQAFDFEDVTSVFEHAATGKLVSLA